VLSPIVLVGVLVCVGVPECWGTAKTPPRWAGSVGRSGRRGFVGLVGAWFARHGENVNVSRPCLDGVDDWSLVGGVVGKCCDAVSFRFALFCCFCDAF